MKTAIRFALFHLLICAPLLAQVPTDSPVDVLRSPGWNKGLFIGGSESFANTPSAQSFLIGARIGRVLTHELGQNALRGSFEMAVDIIPLNEFWIHGAQYAGAIDPFIAKWNFTQGMQVVTLCCGGWRNRIQLPESSSGRHVSGQLHQRCRVGSAMVSSRAQLYQFLGQGLSPVERFAGEQESGHQRRGAVHAGIHVALKKQLATSS